jgi:hypothetical protein
LKPRILASSEFLSLPSDEGKEGEVAGPLLLAMGGGTGGVETVETGTLGGTGGVGTVEIGTLGGIPVTSSRPELEKRSFFFRKQARTTRGRQTNTENKI